MRAIIDFKASNSNPVLEECKTPPPFTGEVLPSNDTVSPTEVERVQQFLQSRNINQTVLRAVESLKPGAADQVMKLAAHISLGKPVQRPRFGIMGSIVRRLRLFQDPNEESISQPQPTISNNYQAPVQVFNWPVFFGIRGKEFV